MIKKTGENKKIKGIKRPHILFNFKYPKFFLLTLTFVLAYILFIERNVPFIEDFISNMGYIGTFLAGILITYGFTSAPATALFLILAKSQNILIASLIGGFGALCGDLIIFHFIRSSFKDELNSFKKERFVKWIDHKIPEKIMHYLLIILAGIIIASPFLPDEIGVSMLSIYNKISVRIFMLLSYLLNTAGIFVILLIGSSI